MKVLIASLQVSQSGSKGHLHPAIEIALECKRRGHSPLLLPLPSPLGEDDTNQLVRADIRYLRPPSLPNGVLKTPAELAALAADSQNTWKAYHSFLVAPLTHQFSCVLDILKKEKPDVVIYDLLSYAAPIAARQLGIPDVGFCAGLKLIAEDSLQGGYPATKEKLLPSLTQFLNCTGTTANFHHLELLSSYGQLVFASGSLVGSIARAPSGTILAGPLPASIERGDLESDFTMPNRDFAVLSFGSVLDPADFPRVTESIIRITERLGLRLVIGSQKLHQVDLPSHVGVYPYLPLPALLKKTRVFFHHGGANTFSEALSSGAPQILIPLTTDQPIQAHYLNQSKAGFSLKPNEVTPENLFPMVSRLFDLNDPIHQKISDVAREYQKAPGAKRAVDFIEQIARSKENL